MIKATSELTGFPIEHALFNGYGPKGPYDGMRDGRRLTDLDERAYRDLIANIPGLRISHIDVEGDVRNDCFNGKWLNA
jgi:hypothetical protein